MRMTKFLAKRLLTSILVLFGLSIVIFCISRIIPGNAARMALGDRASDEAVALLEEQMHLHDPLPVQYWYWLTDVLHGDFGTSLSTRRPVLTDVKAYLPATLELGLMGALMMVLFSICFGSLAARFKNRFPDILIRAGAYIGVAMPAFVIAALFVLLFGYYWQVLPVVGRLSAEYTIPTVTGFMLIDTLLAGNFAAFGDAFLHLLCPAFALACGGMFQEARIIRNAMVESMNKDYLIAHKGYGIPEGLVFRKYLLKPSLIPAISVLGLDVAGMFGGSFLVEIIFVWPGIARYGTNAIMSKDLNAISAVVLITGVIVVIVNIIVDIVVSFLDPRVTIGGDGN